jgi:hypothetical protein
MRLLRIGLHSLMLVLADFAGILGGFVVFKALHFASFEQILIQLPVAAALSILLFGLWSFLLRAFGGKQLLLPDLKELLLVFVASILLAAVAFVPLHLLTQAYLTDIMNVVLLALYQVPVNLIALCIVWILQN